MNKIEKLLAILVLFIWLPATAYGGELDRAHRAYKEGDYKSAFAIFKFFAENENNAEAQYNLGVMYDKGNGVRQDYLKAERQYRKAAEQGFFDAQYSLGYMYEIGRNIERYYNNIDYYAYEEEVIEVSYLKSYMWYLLANEHENKVAQEKIDRLNEIIPIEDIETAKKSFLNCKDSNYKNCYDNLRKPLHWLWLVNKSSEFIFLAVVGIIGGGIVSGALFYANNIRIEEYKKKLVRETLTRDSTFSIKDDELFREEESIEEESIEEESIEEESIEEESIEEESIEEESIEEESIEEENIEEESKEGAEKETAKYRFLAKYNVIDSRDILRRARRGDARAQFEIGERFLKGAGGFIQDCEKAFEWYSKAAEQKYTIAEYTLGMMYYEGECVEQNYEMAITWYKKAARQGLALAQYNVGVMYYKGEGVRQNYEEAFVWCRMAARQKDAKAQYNVGKMYDNGEGVAQNYRKAVKWYSRAARQGLAVAQGNLASMYATGKGVHENHEKALELYSQSAKQGNALSQASLGGMYFIGIGCSKNIIKAYMWTSISKSLGNKESEKLLEYVEKEMSSEDIARSQDLAVKCWLSNYEDCDCDDE